MLSFTDIDHKGCSVTKPCVFSIRLAPIAKKLFLNKPLQS